MANINWNKKYRLDMLCAMCSQECGEHHGDTAECPNGQDSQGYHLWKTGQIFVLQPDKYVKCINNMGNLATAKLKLGGVYRVVKEITGIQPYNGITLWGVDGDWDKDRFVDYDGMDVASPTNGTHSSATSAKVSKRYRPDEECPCGLLSNVCTYHKS
jgi:hypothetical protein